MSTDWSFRCADCNETHDVCYNHGQNRLREVYRAYPLAKQIIEGNYMWVEVPGLLGGDGPAVFGFLHEHDGHHIDLESEYGTIEPVT